MRSYCYNKLTVDNLWHEYHSDEENSSLWEEFMGRWVERVIGEPVPVDPIMWQYPNYCEIMESGDISAS